MSQHTIQFRTHYEILLARLMGTSKQFAEACRRERVLSAPVKDASGAPLDCRVFAREAKAHLEGLHRGLVDASTVIQL